MPLSSEVRSVGQKAAGLCGLGLLFKSLNITTAASDVVPLLRVGGAENAAVLTGVAGVAATLYFLLRAWDENLADKLASDTEGTVARGARYHTIHGLAGQRLQGNLFWQGVTKWLISMVDFWLPVGLSLVASWLLYEDARRLLQQAPGLTGG